MDSMFFFYLKIRCLVWTNANAILRVSNDCFFSRKWRSTCIAVLGLDWLNVVGEVKSGLDSKYAHWVGMIKGGLEKKNGRMIIQEFPQTRQCILRRFRTSQLTSRILKYCAALSRSLLQLVLNPIRSMLGASFPRPARVRQDLPPSSKLWFSVTV